MTKTWPEELSGAIASLHTQSVLTEHLVCARCRATHGRESYHMGLMSLRRETIHQDTNAGYWKAPGTTLVRLLLSYAVLPHRANPFSGFGPET